jgi:DNA-binding transcriptional MerR regulator
MSSGDISDDPLSEFITETQTVVPEQELDKAPEVSSKNFTWPRNILPKMEQKSIFSDISSFMSAKVSSPPQAQPTQPIASVNPISNILDRVLNSQSTIYEVSLRTITEKKALYTIFKRTLRSFLDQTAGSSDAITEDTSLFRLLCTIIQHILFHQFNATETRSDLFSSQKRRTVWQFLESRLDASETALETAKAVTAECSDIERVKWFIHMSLMQQNLATAFLQLIQYPEVTVWYNDGAIMRDVELITEISGMLLSLNSLEFNLLVKPSSSTKESSTEEDLCVSLLNCFMALESESSSSTGNTSRKNSKDLGESGSDLRIMQQNKYLTEQNALLEKRIKELQKKNDTPTQLESYETELEQLRQQVDHLSNDLKDCQSMRQKDKIVLKVTQQHLVQALKAKEELRKKYEGDPETTTE